MPSLKVDLTTEVCVIGAGIAGISVAYKLQSLGYSVSVIEAFDVGSGETGRTTAHLSYVLDDGFQNLESMFGKSGLRVAVESHQAAMDWIEEIVDGKKIDCEFRRLPGYLFLNGYHDKEWLQGEFEAATRAGIKELEVLENAPLPFETGACLRFSNQAQFHPLKYLEALTKAFISEGGQVYTRTPAVSISAGSPAKIETKDGAEIFAEQLVVATNTPINDRFKMHTKQAPYRTYAIAVKVPKNSIEDALYWDTQDPYHYIRLQQEKEEDFLIVGGEDHKTGQEDEPEKCFSTLEKWVFEKFPMAEELRYRWSGQVLEPADSLAFVGRNPGDQNVYIVTGDSGHGMTHASLAALLIADLIEGKENEWEKAYDPNRKTFSGKALTEFTKENLNVAEKYLDWILPSQDSTEKLPRNSGCVVRDGSKRVAFYKDSNDRLHSFDATCPHLKCVVHWNSVESSWDCPCHGSRFDAYGKVITGPATKNLEAHSSSADRMQKTQ